MPTPRKLPRTLDAVEVRVLGALLEKELTTPDQYPLTVNSLLAACNQKTNREPVMALAEGEVWDALDRLRRDVLVWRNEGARAERWSQTVSRRLELSGGERALLTLLLLRGPQTAGELRSRADRLHAFAGVEGVEEALRSLAGREDQPLAAELPRQPGQKENRWAHLLAGAPEIPDPIPSQAAASPFPAASPPPDLAARVDRLEEHLATLTRELAELKARLGE